MSQNFEGELQRTIFCKDCGKALGLLKRAMLQEIAEGRSAPARCQVCRKAHAGYVAGSGAAFFEPQMSEGSGSYFDNKEIGFGRLHRGSRFAEVAVVGADNPAEEADFVVMKPIVRKLLDNLLDPNGTQVSVLIGPTGAGKTVLSPMDLYRAGLGPVLVTQPRRSTIDPGKDGKAKTTPRFVANRLGLSEIGPGGLVGMQMQGVYDMRDNYTQIDFVTDGTVIQWLITGFIKRWRVLFIDEAHEQSPNMEAIFAIIKYVLPLYPELKVVIASATIAEAKFINYYGGPEKVFLAAPEGEDAKTQHPIIEQWPEGPDGFLRFMTTSLPTDPKKLRQTLPAFLAELVYVIRTVPGVSKLGNSNGDFVFFAPTVPLIQDILKAIKEKNPGVETFEYHAQMDLNDLETFLKSEAQAKERLAKGLNPTRQRIIGTTNYGETGQSLAVVHSMDTGWFNQSRYVRSLESSVMVVCRHSKAGAIQRIGRVGRMLAGEAWHLYTREDYEGFPDESPPSLLLECWDTLLLSLKMAGINDLEKFALLAEVSSPPDMQRLMRLEKTRALKALHDKGALDEDGDITPKGIELAGFRSNDIYEAALLSESDMFGCTLEVATFLSMVAFSEKLFIHKKDPTYDADKAALAYGRWIAGCYDDLEYYLRLFHFWNIAASEKGDRAEWAREHGLNHATFKKVKDARQRMLDQFTKRSKDKVTDRHLDLDRLHRVRLLIARCLPQWVYTKNPHQRGEFLPFSPDAPAKQPARFTGQTACVAHDVDAFVCLGREPGKSVEVVMDVDREEAAEVLDDERSALIQTLGEVTFESIRVKHIVRINPEWLPMLKSVGAASLARLLKVSLANDEAIAGGTRQRVLSRIPRADFTQYKPGSILSLRMLRQIETFDGFNGTRKLRILCQDMKASVLPFLATVTVVGEKTQLHRGDVFRADVTSVESRKDHLTVSQVPLLLEYRMGQVIKDARVIRELEDSFLVELECGLNALLKWKGKSLALPELADSIRASTHINVVIAPHSNDKLVAEGKMVPMRLRVYAEGYEPPMGVIVDAIVTRVAGDDSKLFGVEVEFHPDGRGFLHWKKCPEGYIENLKELDHVPVTVDWPEVNKGHIDYRVSYFPTDWQRHPGVSNNQSIAPMLRALAYAELIKMPFGSWIVPSPLARRWVVEPGRIALMRVLRVSDSANGYQKMIVQGHPDHLLDTWAYVVDVELCHEKEHIRPGDSIYAVCISCTSDGVPIRFSQRVLADLYTKGTRISGARLRRELGKGAYLFEILKGINAILYTSGPRGTYYPEVDACVADGIDVEIVGGGRGKPLICLPHGHTPRACIGSDVRCTVVGIVHSKKEGFKHLRVGVRLEFLPGCFTFISHRELGSDRLANLNVGDILMLRYRGEDKKGRHSVALSDGRTTSRDLSYGSSPPTGYTQVTWGGAVVSSMGSQLLVPQDMILLKVNPTPLTISFNANESRKADEFLLDRDFDEWEPTLEEVPVTTAEPEAVQPVLTIPETPASIKPEATPYFQREPVSVPVQQNGGDTQDSNGGDTSLAELYSAQELPESDTDRLTDVNAVLLAEGRRILHSDDPSITQQRFLLRMLPDRAEEMGNFTDAESEFAAAPHNSKSPANNKESDEETVPPLEGGRVYRSDDPLLAREQFVLRLLPPRDDESKEAEPDPAVLLPSRTILKGDDPRLAQCKYVLRLIPEEE